MPSARTHGALRQPLLHLTVPLVLLTVVFVLVFTSTSTTAFILLPVSVLAFVPWSFGGLVWTVRVLRGRRPLQRDREGWTAWVLALLVSLSLTAFGGILVPVARGLGTGFLAIPAAVLLAGHVPLVILVRMMLPLRQRAKPETVVGEWLAAQC